MDPAVASFLTVIGSAVAAYSGAYFKKRGEDKAIEEGFAAVLRQTTETTKATKAIEAKIGDEVWDRQRRFEMKRDFIFEAARTVGKVLGKIVELDSAKKAEQRFKLNEREPNDLILKIGKEWVEMVTEVGNVMTVSSLICGDELTAAFQRFASAMIDHGEAITNVGEDFVQQRSSAFVKEHKSIFMAMRKELAKPLATSQSNESPAAPSSAPTQPK
jgi:hypothetical protein